MNTTALCNECYREIPAVADAFPVDDAVPMLYKICPEHGLQRGILEGDREFYAQYSTYDRKNHYSVLIINVTDRCNILCKHCFYPVKNKWDMPLDQFKTLITIWKSRGIQQFIISGGDPTMWAHYFDAAKWCREHGIFLSQLTNGVRFSEEGFWHHVKENFSFNINGQECLAAEMSIHPEHLTSDVIRGKQLKVLQWMREDKIKQSCIMMNIDTKQHSSIELDREMNELVDFMIEWQDVTVAFRIRPICFDAWAEKARGVKYHLSDLVKSLLRVTSAKQLKMEYSFDKDIDNIYNQNFKIGGINVVTVCAANIRSLDLGYLNRGPFMLANDGRAYSVPHALIINEGIDKGYYGGCKC